MASRKKKNFFWLVIPTLLALSALYYVYASRPAGDISVEPKNLLTLLPKGILLQPPATITPTVSYRQPGSSAVLPGAKWVPQSFNNCGPATTSMLLQYFGHNVSQEVTKAALRTNPTDSNVFTYEIRDYLKNTYNVDSKLFYNGTPERLKILLVNNFYIMIEDWLYPGDDVGHNTIIRGFDDERGVFISDDSYIGTNTVYKYEVFDHGQWKPFNREYLVLYKKEQEPVLRAIVGDDWDEKTMYQRSVETNKAATVADPNDVYSWFNLGTSYYHLGDYQNSKLAFEKAQSIGWPRRMLWYQYEPIKTYNKLGEHQKALVLIRQGLTSNDSYAELHLEAAIAYKGLGDMDAARSEVQKALNYAPNLKGAIEFSSSL